MQCTRSAVAGAFETCFANIVIALFFFQLIFALFIPLLTRTRFSSHWPGALVRQVTLLVVFKETFDELGDAALGVMVVFEAVAFLVIYLDERTARENFVLNSELDKQRRVITDFLSFIMHEVRRRRRASPAPAAAGDIRN